MASGLVDVVRLFVYPVVQGHRRRLFDGPMPGRLTLVDTRTFASGIVLLAYRSAASPSPASPSPAAPSTAAPSAA